MQLLQGMLERDPQNRLSSKEALLHPAFTTVMSKSPFIARPLLNSEVLINHVQLVHALDNKQKFT